MKEYFKKFPQELQDLIRLVSDIARTNNIRAYLIGGFVRDLLLGVKNLDLDIAVEGDGIRFAELISRRLNVKLVRHRRFGTATVIVKPHLKIDIASTRRESYPQPGELPEVSAGTLDDDLYRRDFSINAMAISINRDDFGRFIDLFRGRQDLGHKKIRVLHDLSFIDDPTRILRAIRFEQRFGFRIEPVTLRLLKEAIRLKMLNKVHSHRLRDEIVLILKEEKVLKYIKRIQALAKLDFISPGLTLSKKTQSLVKAVERQMTWFKNNFPGRRQLDTWLIYFMAMADLLNINRIKSASRRFGLRKGEEKRMLSYKQKEKILSRALSRAEIKPAMIFHLLEPLSYEVTLLLKAKYKNSRLQKRIEEFFAIYNGMRTCVCGEDLHRLGLAPGPFYQQVFTKVLKAKLNGLVKSEEEEAALARKLARDKLR